MAAGANATVHVTAGIAGITHSSDWVVPAPAWVRVQNRRQYGYVRFDVANRTHMRGAAVDSTNDTTFDEFWLTA